LKAIIDIGHPGHVHLYRHLATSLKKNGDTVYTTVKQIESAICLLESFDWDHLKIGKKKDSILEKALNQFLYNYRVLRLIKKEGIQVGIGTSVTLSHLSKITKMDSILFDDDDDEVQPLFVKYAHPYCTYLLSPESLKGKRKKKNTIYYPGYHELAYLHPNRFTPDPDVLSMIGLKEGEVFFVLRFNVFKAHHDVGEYGIALKDKIRLVEMLNNYGKVFITAERNIEPELEKYRMALKPEKIHSLLYYANMFVGDSQTMTSEAAVLGTPAIRSNTFVKRISYLDELEYQYGLTFGYLPQEFDMALEKIRELINFPNLKDLWAEKRRKMLADKIDVSQFMIWLIDGYPESMQIAKNANNDFWEIFR